MSAQATFEGACEQLRAGEVDFNQFVESTRRHWRALSRYVASRWAIPTWLDREDIEQDMLTAVWLFVGKYDASRGTSLEGYLVFNAIDKAKKKVHKARGARLHRTADSNPSRFETPVSALAREGDDESEARIPVPTVHATQHETIEDAQTLERARSVCGSVRELLVVQALEAEQHSISRAAFLLYEDAESRRLCRLVSEEHAARVVTQAVRRVAERLQFLPV